MHKGKMEQILLAYGLPKETVTAIMILYENTKAKVRSPNEGTDFFDVVTGIFQGDTLAPYLLIIYLHYVLPMSRDLIKENGFKQSKKQTMSYRIYKSGDYADDLALLANRPSRNSMA